MYIVNIIETKYLHYYKYTYQYIDLYLYKSI